MFCRMSTTASPYALKGKLTIKPVRGVHRQGQLLELEAEHA